MVYKTPFVRSATSPTTGIRIDIGSYGQQAKGFGLPAASVNSNIFWACCGLIMIRKCLGATACYRIEKSCRFEYA
ncbi:hypothetical protein [Mucilaginibacter sp. AK015]|uniref:hypothetical protein n=1 Tax=Mucilaginibacter sp. AK015 TaxID=2723072 RepID=UPI00161BB469|nr:hypothetical protein [Mucilaginibacter sp. AK015]MBB5395601.1 hypothetical protein [Mucilaginibacter sp. AK015]